MRPEQSSGRLVRGSSSVGTLAVVVAVLVASPPAVADDVGADEPIDLTEVPTQAPPDETRFDPMEIGAMTMDAVILRPLGLVATAAGLAMFMASTPLVLPTQELPTTWDIFVLGPADYTFFRPLGDF